MTGPAIYHPSRYPKHKTDKGQVVGGLCNITACEEIDANWYNNQTYAYYCRTCAMGINQFERQFPVCRPVDKPLSVDEMSTEYKTYWEARKAS